MGNRLGWLLQLGNSCQFCTTVHWCLHTRINSVDLSLQMHLHVLHFLSNLSLTGFPVFTAAPELQVVFLHAFLQAALAGFSHVAHFLGRFSFAKGVKSPARGLW